MLKKLLQILFIALIFGSCGNENGESKQILTAKKTVQKVFQFSSKDDFDSLRFIISLISDESDDYLKVKFSGIKELVTDEEFPTEDELRGESFSSMDNRICTIKYRPKKINKPEIDSIVFTFDKLNGLNKVSTFEVFETVKELKPILSPGVNLKQ